MKVIKMFVFEKGKFRNKKRTIEFAIRNEKGIIIIDNKKLYVTDEYELIETCQEILKIYEEKKKKNIDFKEEFKPKSIKKIETPKENKEMGDMKKEEDFDFL